MKKKSLKRSPFVQFFLMSMRGFLREPSILFWAFVFPLLTTFVFAQAFSGGGGGSSTDGFVLALHDAAKLDQKWIERIRAESGSIKVIDLQAADLPDLAGLQGVKSIDSVAALPVELKNLFLTQKVDVLLSPYGVFSVRTQEQFKSQENYLLALRERAYGGSLQSININVPGMRFIDWFVPGMLGLTLLTGGLFGVSFRIVSDRELGLFKRLLLGPFNKLDYILGFSLARAIVMFVQLVVLTWLFHLAFGFRIQGNIFLFLGFAFAGGLCSSLLGAAVASRTRKSETAGGITNVFFFPMMFLSGVYFKTENFPDWLRKFADLLPLTAINEGLRSIANEAVPFVTLWPHVALIAIWSAVCLGITVKFFDWGAEA